MSAPASRHRSRLQRSLAPLALAFAVTACGSPAASGAPGSALPEGTPTVSAAPAGLASPVVGQVVKLDTEGLAKVHGFVLRLDSGEEVTFTIGVLENGAEFPPGHLSEHMSTGEPVRVSFRDEGGALVVYRIDDASGS
jgi:hypothetical protein